MFFIVYYWNATPMFSMFIAIKIKQCGLKAQCLPQPRATPWG